MVDTPQFVYCVFCTDEAVFTRSDAYKLCHVWAKDNPLATCHSSFQQRFNTNVSAGSLDDYVIGPNVIQDRLSGAHCTDFLEKMLQFYRRMCLYVCGRACCFSTTVPLPIFHILCSTATTTFRINGLTRSQITWPPRSPDLTPYIFICVDTWKKNFKLLKFGIATS
jgi:hypothetical protein